ncbi:MAG: hypothetical protein ABSG89_00130 [Bacteroidales bacterium]|jgi:hypothetical protein
MKAKLTLISVILLAISFQSLHGQASYPCSCTGKINSGPSLPGELFSPAEPPDNITFFNEEWLPGDIYLDNGEIVRNIYIKYNMLLDELLWLQPESKRIIKLDKEGILQFHFLNYQGDTAVYFKRITAKRYLLADSSKIFGQEIYKGMLSLYILHNFVIERQELTDVNGIYCQKNVYGEEPVYYLKLMNQKAVGLTKINRKNLYAFAPDKKEQIKKFFRENRQMEFKTDPELISLAQFLSSILTP